MIRTHQAGTLRAQHAGETVVLAGWVARRRDHGGVVFIDLRDASGTVQVVWRSEEAAVHELRAEYCVKVTGVVRERPAGNENLELPTGAIEVVADTLDVLSEADPLPFPVEGTAEISEDVRIKYRYLDIRQQYVLVGPAATKGVLLEFAGRYELIDGEVRTGVLVARSRGLTRRRRRRFFRGQPDGGLDPRGALRHRTASEFLRRGSFPAE